MPPDPIEIIKLDAGPCVSKETKLSRATTMYSIVAALTSLNEVRQRRIQEVNNRLTMINFL